MINEQLFMRVLETLKSNNDAVILAVAGAGGKACKVCLQGPDQLLIPLIDSIAASYMDDIMKKAVQLDSNNIEEMLHKLHESMSETNESMNKTENLVKEVEDALGEIDWGDLLGEDGTDGQN
jgi:hypothetical protein